MRQLHEIREHQAGVVCRRQVLDAGLRQTDVARALRRRDWFQVHPGVYVGHNGALTWEERAWAAVLHAWPAALSGGSAIRALDPGARRLLDTEPVELVVDRHRRLTSRPGIVLRRTAHLDRTVLWNASPPRRRVEEALLDVAARSSDDLSAVAALTAACGARRTTAARLQSVLADRPRHPRRAWVASVLADLTEGSCSVLEHGYLTRVERPHALPVGVRQAPRAAAGGGGAWQDVAYEPHLLVVELDGRLFHSSARDRDRDLERDLHSAVTRAETTVRLGYHQVFERGCSTARQIGTLLNRLGWRGSAKPCPQCGALRQAG